MAVAINNGTYLDYEILPGDGPPLLLIRGLSRSRRYWLGFDTRLAESFTVVIFDNRGFGRSSRPGGLWSVAQMADDAAAVVRAAGFDKAHIYGMSLGGMIAQEVVLRHPELVDHLILGCTTPGGKEGIPPSPFAVARLAIAMALPMSMSNDIIANLTLSPGHNAAHPETAQAWLSIMKMEAVPRLSVIRQLLAILGHRTGPRLKEIAAPTLILSGGDDRLIDRRNSEYLARNISGAQLRFLPGAGHDFPAEQVDETARAIEEFCLPWNLS